MAFDEDGEVAPVPIDDPLMDKLFPLAQACVADLGLGITLLRYVVCESLGRGGAGGGILTAYRYFFSSHPQKVPSFWCFDTFLTKLERERKKKLSGPRLISASKHIF